MSDAAKMGQDPAKVSSASRMGQGPARSSVSTHSPGPWRWGARERGEAVGHLLDANGDVVILADGMRLDGFHETARLIAAAPEMLELLRTLGRGLLDENGKVYGHDLDKLRDLLARIEGKP